MVIAVAELFAAVGWLLRIYAGLFGPLGVLALVVAVLVAAGFVIFAMRQVTSLLGRLFGVREFHLSEWKVTHPASWRWLRATSAVATFVTAGRALARDPSVGLALVAFVCSASWLAVRVTQFWSGYPLSWPGFIAACRTAVTKQALDLVWQSIGVVSVQRGKLRLPRYESWTLARTRDGWEYGLHCNGFVPPQGTGGLAQIMEACASPGSEYDTITSNLNNILLEPGELRGPLVSLLRYTNQLPLYAGTAVDRPDGYPQGVGRLTLMLRLPLERVRTYPWRPGFWAGRVQARADELAAAGKDNPVGKAVAELIAAGAPVGFDADGRVVRADCDDEHTCLMGSTRALDLDTRIPTPAGWTTMRDIEVGSQVFGADGRVINVVDKSPVFEDRPCWTVRFEDGTEIVADDQHQWAVFTRYDRARRSAHARADRDDATGKRTRRYNDQRSKRNVGPRVVTTTELPDLVTNGRGQANCYVQVTAAIDGPDRDLPIDPYVLGLWLGDGHSAAGRITTADTEIVDAIRNAGYELGFIADRGAAKTYTVYGLQAQLRALGVLGHKAIPTEYARASFKQRLALLQGIMDTDGYLQRTGAVEITLAHHELLRQVRELVCSLGHRPGRIRRRVITRDGKEFTSWRLGWKPLDPAFRLPRKLAGQVIPEAWQTNAEVRFRRVVAVEPASPRPTQCIAVDSPDHLWLCGESFIPTHNTGKSTLLECLLHFITEMPTQLVRLAIIDMKGGAHLNGYRDRASAYATNAVEAVAVLEAIATQVVTPRWDLLRATDRQKITEPTEDEPYWFVIVDEGGKLPAEAMDLLAKLSMEGAAGHCIVVFSTQYMRNEDGFPRQLDVNLSNRLSTRLTDATASAKAMTRAGMNGSCAPHLIRRSLRTRGTFCHSAGGADPAYAKSMLTGGIRDQRRRARHAVATWGPPPPLVLAAAPAAEELHEVVVPDEPEPWSDERLARMQARLDELVSYLAGNHTAPDAATITRARLARGINLARRQHNPARMPAGPDRDGVQQVRAEIERQARELNADLQDRDSVAAEREPAGMVG